MIVRDPVHGVISFRESTLQWVTRVLDTPEFQRLRRIRQLGLAALVFPGAEHTRFSHAVGTGHVMARLLERLRAREGDVPAAQRVAPGEAVAAMAASLCHDLGHGPFSHLFEALVPRNRGHEGWTEAILREPSTALHQVLEEVESGMANRVAELLQGGGRLPYLSSAISGTMDVDRCDYLLRDSLMTGVRYGLFDLDWLQEVLVLRERSDGQWVLSIDGEKGLPPVEGFFLGRHHMHQQVYHHRATRSAERLLQHLFERVAESVQDGCALPLAPALASAHRGELPSLGEYLALDDSVVMSCLAAWEVGPDPVVADMARRLRNRHLFKSLTLPSDLAVQEEALQRGRSLASDHPWGAERAVFLDSRSSHAYPQASGDATEVWVWSRHHTLKPLSQVSAVVEQLAKTEFSQTRLLFVPELRERIEGAVLELVSDAPMEARPW